MQSSSSCRLWPIMNVHRGPLLSNVVGLHFTSLTFAASDFDVDVVVTGLTPDQNAELQHQLELVIEKAKPQILANLPTTISEAART